MQHTAELYTDPTLLYSGLLVCWYVGCRGVVCYTITILTALSGTTATHFLIALLSVGLGWNFLYTAGSAMVS